jgi:hypothetical protein
VELLLNLAWALVSCLLVAVWAFGALRAPRTGRHRRDSLLPQRHTQVVALLLLIVVLLPVISLTDDLMMSATMGETEHAQRLDLWHDGLTALQHAWPGVLAAMSLLQLPARVPRRDWAGIETQSPAHSLGFYRPIESRPPPAA